MKWLEKVTLNRILKPQQKQTKSVPQSPKQRHFKNKETTSSAIHLPLVLTPLSAVVTIRYTLACLRVFTVSEQ